MLQESTHSNSAWRYDLGVTLHTPDTLFIEPIGDRYVAFAPDWKGLPVILDARTLQLLESFRSGRVVSRVMMGNEDPVATLATIGDLFDRGFLREREVRLPYPPPMPQDGTSPESLSIWLHITNFCNLGCSYCFVGEKTREGMTEPVMDKVVDDIFQTTVSRGCKEVAIKFAGGEPTLSLPAMKAFHQKLTTKMRGTDVAVRFGILSNGTVLNPPLLNFIKEHQIGISISVDGYAESHDIHRVFKGSGHGSWDILSKTISTLARENIRPYMMATISEESCHTLPDLVRWLYEHQLRARLSVVRQPKGSWAPGQEDAYKRLTRTLAEAFDRAFEALEDKDIIIDLRSGLDLCELNFDEPAHGQPCGIASNHLVIKPDGSLVSCPMEVAKAGVVSNGDLISTCAKTFDPRPSTRHYDDPENSCLHCQWFGVCAGGCPVTNLRIKGYAYTRSPLCAFYKAVIPRYLRFFGRKLVQAEAREQQMQSVVVH